MRLLVLLGVFVALAATTASAASATVDRTAGSVYVQFQNGNGTTKIRYRGNLLVNVARGSVTVTANIAVAGADYPRKKLDSGLMLYRGRNMSFHTPSTQRWRARLTGFGISASGFVRGCMTLNAVDSGPTGAFRIGQKGTWRLWPRLARTYKLGWGC